MYDIYYTYDDFGDHDAHWCTVATGEEAQRICDYANLHNYNNAERWWYTKAKVSTAEEILASMKKEFHKASSLKEEIKRVSNDLEEAKEFNDKEWIEEFSNMLVKLQAELAEVEKEVNV